MRAERAEGCGEDAGGLFQRAAQAPQGAASFFHDYFRQGFCIHARRVHFQYTMAQTTI
jgi:hypothetical protein